MPSSTTRNVVLGVAAAVLLAVVVAVVLVFLGVPVPFAGRGSDDARCVAVTAQEIVTAFDAAQETRRLARQASANAQRAAQAALILERSTARAEKMAAAGQKQLAMAAGLPTGKPRRDAFHEGVRLIYDETIMALESAREARDSYLGAIDAGHDNVIKFSASLPATVNRFAVLERRILACGQKADLSALDKDAQAKDIFAVGNDMFAAILDADSLRGDLDRLARAEANAAEAVSAPNTAAAIAEIAR